MSTENFSANVCNEDEVAVRTTEFETPLWAKSPGPRLLSNVPFARPPAHSAAVSTNRPWRWIFVRDNGPHDNEARL